MYKLPFHLKLREAAKKVLFLMAGPLRKEGLPPQAKWPLELSNKIQKKSKKKFFFLNGLTFTPPFLRLPFGNREGSSPDFNFVFSSFILEAKKGFVYENCLIAVSGIVFY